MRGQTRDDYCRSVLRYKGNSEIVNTIVYSPRVCQGMGFAAGFFSEMFVSGRLCPVTGVSITYTTQSVLTE